jgi:small redox-active disulfide protein 2
MKIEVFGPGCHKCHETEKVVRDAVSELGVQVDVEKIKDMMKIIEAGIMLPPGIRINGKIKCSGRVPKIEEVKKWIGEEK